MCLEPTTIRPCHAGILGPNACDVPRIDLGPVPDLHRYRRIYSGVFTPTEAAAMSAVYAFIVAVFVYKDLKLRDVPRVLLSSANLSAMRSLITNAVLFSFC